MSQPRRATETADLDGHCYLHKAVAYEIYPHPLVYAAYDIDSFIRASQVSIIHPHYARANVHIHQRQTQTLHVLPPPSLEQQ